MLDYKWCTLFLSLVLLQAYPCFSKGSMNPEDYKNVRVYLASFPHSGNHWCRYLVESASCIATGAVYIDRNPPHMKKVFPWGGYCAKNGYEGNCRYPSQDELVLIKTHFPSDEIITEFDQLPYKKAIVLVRHPIDAFYSRYLSLKIKDHKDKVPFDIVEGFIRDFKRFLKYWDKQKNVTFIRYEDMMENPKAELIKICNILNYHLTDEQYQNAVDMHPPIGETYKHIGRYRKQELQFMRDKLSDVLKRFGYDIPTERHE